MSLPKVAIIGRPNVGKSSLFNTLAGRLISIVEPTAGVTRDCISTVLARDDRYIELFDTGGYGMPENDLLGGDVSRQILGAIESADLIVFTVDVQAGLIPLDRQIARIIHASGKRSIAVANKADNATMARSAADFSGMGFGQVLCVSAKNRINTRSLLDEIFSAVSDLASTRPGEPVMKIAVVGKRNAGKSTLVNAMAGCERVIVSEIPGTTRDSVDVRIEKDGRTILVIDTAGLRKKKSLADSIEFYSNARAERSVRRADVVLILIDATEKVSQVDKKLATMIEAEQKSCILVVNKWDLAKNAATGEDYAQYLTRTLPGLKYAPIAFTTATDSRNIQAVLDLAAEIFKQSNTRISTGRLNKAFDTIRRKKPASAKKGRVTVPRIYYAAQVAVNPITIMLSVNRPSLLDEGYLRFVAGTLRSCLPVSEVPIRLLVRAHRKQ